jgi:DNA (cytosine-5)-methyltransferase 1
MTAQPRVVSLFCGAGGMDLGFVRAGFEVVWANDAWADACATYRRNLGDHVCCRDVRSVDAAELPPCDVVIGGPPCQGYSVGGRMDPDDPRSALTWEFVRLVGRLRPRAFVLENVKALAVLQRWAPVRARLLGRLEGLGYTVGMHLLDARAYGVPQGRQRVFFVGTAAAVPPARSIPPTVDRPRTAGEVLRGLPPPGVAPNLGVCGAKVVPAKKPVLRRSPFAGMLFNGQGRPIDLGSAVNTLPASMGGNRTPIVDEAELREGRPPWVAAYHARLLRGLPPLAAAPDRLRRLTVTEAALLQTFPAAFRFEGKQNSQYAQIGNAVPPLLAEAVAGRVLLSLRGIAAEVRSQRSDRLGPWFLTSDF